MLKVDTAFLQEKGRYLIETTPTTGLELSANESHHFAIT